MNCWAVVLFPEFGKLWAKLRFLQSQSTNEQVLATKLRGILSQRRKHMNVSFFTIFKRSVSGHLTVSISHFQDFKSVDILQLLLEQQRKIEENKIEASFEEANNDEWLNL